MKATVENINSVQRRLKVFLPTDVVNLAFDETFKKFQNKAKISGFRPGKAPLNLVRKLYGDSASQEVTEKLIRENLFVAINNEGLRPVAAPFVETMDLPLFDKEFNFSAVVDIMPQVDIGDFYKGLEVEVTEHFLKPDDLDVVLSGEARKRAEKQPVSSETLADELCEVYISTQVFDEQDQVIDELSVEHMKVELDHKTIIPDLKSALLGMKNKERKSVKIHLPTEFGIEKHADQTYRYEICIDGIEKLQIPAIDDVFAQGMGYQNLDAMKSDVLKRLNQMVQNTNQNAVENSLLNALKQKIVFDIPPALVDETVNDMIKSRGMKKGDEQKALQDNELRKTLRPEALERCRNSIVLSEVIKKEKLQVSDEEIKQEIFQHVGQDMDENSEAFKKLLLTAREKVMERLVFQKVFHCLETLNTVKKVSVPYYD